MNHKFEFRIRRNPFRRAIRKNIRRTTRQKGSQRTFLKAAQIRKVRRVRHTSVVHYRGIHADTRQLAVADQEGVQRRHGFDGSRPCLGGVGNYAHVDMVHDLAVARLDLRCPNPFSFGEIGRYEEMLVGVLARLNGKSSPMSMTMSGLPNRQPSRKSGVGGRSRGLPSGAPPSTQDLMVSISLSESRASLAKLPKCGSANHGGILRISTASRMDLAHGRADW